MNRVFSSCLIILLFFFSSRDSYAGEIFENKNFRGEKILIKFTQYGEAGEVEYSRIIFEKFVEENPDIKVEVSVYPWGQYWAKLQVQSGSGLAPDVLTLFSGIIGVWAARGALLPLDDLIKNSGFDLNLYHKKAIESCLWDNKLFTFPVDIPTRVLIYKPYKLEQSGISRKDWPRVDKPMHWEQFKKLVRKMTLRNPDGSFSQYGMVGGLAWDEYMFRIYGGELMDQYIQPTKTTIKGNKALEKGFSEIFKLQYGDRGHLGDLPLRAANVNLSSLLYSDKFVMGVDGPWTLRNLEKDGQNYALSPVPYADSHAPFITVNAVGIFSGTKYPEQSWRLIQFLAGEFAQGVYARRLRGVPSLKAAKQAMLHNDYGAKGVEAFFYDLDYAIPGLTTDNNYLVPVFDKWRIRMETEINAEYDAKFILIPRTNGKILDGDYRKFTSHMDKFIEKKVHEYLPLLSSYYDEAFQLGKRKDPGVFVRVILPIVIVLLIIAAAIYYLYFIHRNKEKVTGNGRYSDAGGYITISPWLIGLFCFTLGPILAAFVLSFTEWNMISPPKWIGVQQYVNLFNDNRFFTGLDRTVKYALLTIPISFFGGLFTAGLLTFNIRGTAFFKAAFYFPSLFTGAAAAVLWYNMYNIEYGVVNYFLGFFGISPVNWLDEQHAFAAVVIMNIFWVGGAMIIYYAGMKQIPASLYEAAEIDGAGFFRKFISITIPNLAPVIVFMSIMSTIGAFQVFTPALFFAERSSTIGEPGDALRFYSVNIYDEAFNNLNMGKACAYAMLLFLIIFLVTMIQLKFSRKFVNSAPQ
ncbi:MAG: extracellular solute-binding protein [Ignavibacteriales bacterium]|nr:extracellular solute-binding protein [Ignavibacteriales bacterium]MCF8306568.1 extracellular solute-binding protein [Ignavibacteriales bacterium]MCF8316367.1 extracellular solute-binding protein [Ignavibacteriales bacterium]MCF8437675.1 extracellular solute-binding protein [Ignavibacteriales bacterium]